MQWDLPRDFFSGTFHNPVAQRFLHIVISFTKSFHRVVGASFSPYGLTVYREKDHEGKHFPCFTVCDARCRFIMVINDFHLNASGSQPITAAALSRRHFASSVSCHVFWEKPPTTSDALCNVSMWNDRSETKFDAMGCLIFLSPTVHSLRLGNRPQEQHHGCANGSFMLLLIPPSHWLKRAEVFPQLNKKNIPILEL